MHKKLDIQGKLTKNYKGDYMNIRKCAIIGCGFVGATTAFTLSGSGLFSELVLIDINKKKAEGEAMDINHGLSFRKPMKIYAGNYEDLADCSLIIITAGANQEPGQTRRDLIDKNVAIFKAIVPAIAKVNKDAILLVVTNPVDILTYVTWKLSGFDRHRVIGSGTVLDTARLKYLTGEYLGVDFRSIHAFIIGEHGDSELAVWSSANVSGIDLDGFCEASGRCDGMKCIYSIYDKVKNSAYEIIERKQATYYAIALAVRRIAEAIVRDEHSVLPVSAYADSHYGINDVFIGIPSIVGRNGVERVLDIPLSEDEHRKLCESAKMLKEMINQLDL